VVNNLVKEKSYVKVYLNGTEAKPNVLKKATTGYSQWEMKYPIDADHVTVAYKLTKPEKFGPITFTVINICPEIKGDYAAQTDFIITPKKQKPENMMKENVTYELSRPQASFMVIDANGKEVKGVKLISGKKYMLQLTIRGDISETACVYFKTK